MQFTSFQLYSFRSVIDSGPILFGPGFNFVVGPNNSGKTALIEAMTLRFSNEPHLSSTTIPYLGASPRTASHARAILRLDKPELLRFFEGPARAHYLALSPSPGSPGESSARFEEIVNRDATMLELHVDSNGLQDIAATGYGSLLQGAAFVTSVTASDTGITLSGASGSSNVEREKRLGWSIAETIRSSIYYFRAERLALARTQAGDNNILESDARNLPECIQWLQTNNHRLFDAYIAAVRSIIPSVQRITAPFEGGHMQIRIWSEGVDHQREDLAVPLERCGTGVGQVLAILYVVLTSRTPTIIIIDEPQSFLHPGALRRLLDIMARHVQHQYIIATHSPQALSMPETSSITLVTLEGVCSRFVEIDSNAVADLQSILSVLGIRHNDMFGAEAIIWVEGRTEELCFPLVMRGGPSRVANGVAILGLVATGDLAGRHSGRILDIYHRLSTAGALLPRTVGFILDREGRSEQDMIDMRRQSRNQIRFMKRRMFENYLLNAEAIAAVARECWPDRGEPASASVIAAKLEALRREDAIDSERWLSEAHGAKVMSLLYDAIWDRQYEYDKVKDGVAITKWIVEHTPDAFDDIRHIIAECVSETSAT